MPRLIYIYLYIYIYINLLGIQHHGRRKRSNPPIRHLILFIRSNITINILSIFAFIYIYIYIYIYKPVGHTTPWEEEEVESSNPPLDIVYPQ